MLSSEVEKREEKGGIGAGVEVADGVKKRENRLVDLFTFLSCFRGGGCVKWEELAPAERSRQDCTL